VIAWWWSWLLMIIGITGLWLAGNRKTIGWMIGVGAQVPWVAYALATSQWGFLVSALVYGTVYARNMIKWKRQQKEEATA